MAKYVFQLLFIASLCFTIYNALEWTDRITATISSGAGTYLIYTILGLVASCVTFILVKITGKKKDNDESSTNLNDYFNKNQK